jgi:betaine-aldehyde dehydrogenase
MEHYKMFIDGKWFKAESGETYSVINPANGEEFATVPLGGKAEVNKAVDAARKAFSSWSQMAQADRSKIMLKIAGVLKEKSSDLAEIETLDHGFPISVSEMVVQLSASIFEYAAMCAKTLMSDVIPFQNSYHVYMQREPVGVTALITPWNVPLNSVVKKVAYSIAVGNTCVVKPPIIDSLSALKFAEIIEKCGLPPGVVNIVTGPGASVGEYLASHPGINMISFTGSSETGKIIMGNASKTLKRIQLELGGKNPFIIMEDADIESALQAGVPAVIFNSGQVCGSPGRFYVHENIYSQFVEKYVSAFEKVVVGEPTNRMTQMGPLVSAEHLESVERYIQAGLKEGARLLYGGKRPNNKKLGKGYYLMPTVFADVQQEMKIACEEIFGPVACIIKFSSEEEVIEKANDNKYGLCASIWTKDTARGMKMTQKIQSGSVWVNSTPGPSPEIPWGGFKESGIGKEYSIIGFEDVTQYKVVGIKIA